MLALLQPLSLLCEKTVFLNVKYREQETEISKFAFKKSTLNPLCSIKIHYLIAALVCYYSILICI